MKLSNPQKRALLKLTGEWQSADQLKVGLRTLDCLCRKGLAEHKRILFSGCDPRQINTYRRVKDWAMVVVS